MMPLVALALALAQDTGTVDTVWADSGTSDTGVDTAAPVPPPPAYPRPIGYWPLDEVDTVVADLAHDHEGLLVGTSDVGGIAGLAQQFGPGAWANLGDHLSPMISGQGASYSLSVWLRPDELHGGMVWSKGSDPSVCAASERAVEQLVHVDRQGRVVVDLHGSGGGRLKVRSVGAVPVDAWSHLVVVQDGFASTSDERVRLYLDGVPWAADVLVAQGIAFAIADTEAPLSLGTQVDLDGAPCSTRSFHGALDEASAFNVALSDAQVAALTERSLAGASLLAEHDPTDLLFLLDTSGSMNTGSPLSGQQGTHLALSVAASYLTTAPGPADTVTAVLFSESPSLWTPPMVIADDPEALIEQWSTFDDLAMGGLTNHAAAFGAARQLLAERADEGRFQAIVLITDGVPTGFERDTLVSEVEAVQASGIHVWAIGFGAVDDAFMAHYIQGFGTSVRTPDASGLSTVLLDVVGSTP